MRLGLVIYGSLDSRSGGYLYDRQLVQELERAGDQVTVIPLPARNYPRHLLDNFSGQLLARLVAAPCDVLLQDELNHPSLFWMNRRLKQQVSTPLVSIVHHLRSSESSRLSWFYRQVEKAYLKTLDGAIYNSPTTKHAVETLAQLPGVVALPGRDHLNPKISDAQIVNRAHQSGALRVVFIGNLIPRKGLDTLLRALARLPDEDWTLAVAGDMGVDERYSREMKRLCAELGIERRVKFLGHRSSFEITGLLENGHLLVVPSQYEGFGIVYLEAMGFGLPPLASAAGGARDLIQHGENGYLLQPGDVQGLAVLLRGLHDDRELLARLSLTARRTFEAHPTWSQSAKQVRAFLKRLSQEHVYYLT
jgi:glycosyltransferase involved in cell wall biosynthesis